MCENHVAWSLFKASNSESGTFPAAKIFVGLTKKNLESDIWVNAENSERQRNKAQQSLTSPTPQTEWVNSSPAKKGKLTISLQ